MRNRPVRSLRTPVRQRDHRLDARIKRGGGAKFPRCGSGRLRRIAQLCVRALRSPIFAVQQKAAGCMQPVPLPTIESGPVLQ
jgi:hypothetical protein